MEKFMTIKQEQEQRKVSKFSRLTSWFKKRNYLNHNFALKMNALKKTTAVLLSVAILGQFTVGMLKIGAAAGDPANLDGSLAVANITQGTSYNENHVNALVDEVVMFHLAYHNTEPPASGTDAYNVHLEISLPQGTGTVLTAAMLAQGSNTNPVSDIVAVHTQVPAQLEYIPGSAVWKHNTGTDENPNWVEQTVSDNIVSGGINVGTVKPCWDMQGTVTILARVTGSFIDIEKQVAHEGSSSWSETINAQPGDRIMYAISFENAGNTRLTNLLIGDNLPAYMTYVPGSTWIYTPSQPSGYNAPDGITAGRLNLGDYAVGSGGHAVFRVDINENVPSGCHNLRNVGIADSDQTPEVWDYAYVNVCGIVEQAPEFAISKSAHNVTQDVNATTTLARAGDVIRYTLRTSNVGNAAGNYTISDDLGDVLDYADVTNTHGGTLTGNTISYGTVNIAAGQAVDKNFEVLVKPFNQWPESGDLDMVNFYGNEVVVNLGYPRIDIAKSAMNNTQNVNAETAIARAGDVITYTLVTRNTGNDTAYAYVVSDDISDILEYADVTDSSGGTVSGGVISWSAQDIAAGQQLTNNFTITVKNPIPTNTQSGTSFDYKMDNVYGNLVSIEIERPVVLGGIIAGAQVTKLAAAGASNWLIVTLMLVMFNASAFLYIRERYLLELATKAL